MMRKSFQNPLARQDSRPNDRSRLSDLHIKLTPTASATEKLNLYIGGDGVHQAATVKKLARSALERRSREVTAGAARLQAT